METEITTRMGVGWINWKKCTGVLYDRRMPATEGEYLQTVIRQQFDIGKKRRLQRRDKKNV